MGVLPYCAAAGTGPLQPPLPSSLGNERCSCGALCILGLPALSSDPQTDTSRLSVHCFSQTGTICHQITLRAFVRWASSLLEGGLVGQEVDTSWSRVFPRPHVHLATRASGKPRQPALRGRPFRGSLLRPWWHSSELIFCHQCLPSTVHLALSPLPGSLSSETEGAHVIGLSL